MNVVNGARLHTPPVAESLEITVNDILGEDELALQVIETDTHDKPFGVLRPVPGRR
jgi:hypothetical protein